VTETPTLWSAVYSNLTPNMGDYLALLADEQGVYPAWADGRDADPDVYASFWPNPRSVRAIAPQGGTPLSTGFVLSWLAPPHVPMRATAYRRASGEPEVAIGDLETDSDGALSILDVGLSPGFRYHYELAVRSTEGELRVGAQSVDVPDSLPGRLAIERLSPNPSDGVFRVSFRRPDLRPARVEVLDVGGRRVLGLDLGQEYGARGVVELPRSPRLEPGLYVVRLVQSGSAASVKAVVIR
jgi:hypothetical protein